MRLALLWEREPRTRPQDHVPPSDDICSMAIVRFMQDAASGVEFVRGGVRCHTPDGVRMYFPADRGTLSALIAAANAVIDGLDAVKEDACAAGTS